MTTRELIMLAGQHPQWMAMVLGVPALLAAVLGFLHPKRQGHKSAFKWVYSAIVYAACIPGMAAIALLAYTALVTRQNLLDVNVLVYFAPPLAMAGTLGLVGRNASFNGLPGFDRIWGLMLMLGMAFLSVFVLSRMSFSMVFLGSFWNLLLVALGIFVAFRYGAKLAFGSRT